MFSITGHHLPHSGAIFDFGSVQLSVIHSPILPSDVISSMLVELILCCSFVVVEVVVFVVVVVDW